MMTIAQAVLVPVERPSRRFQRRTRRVGNRGSRLRCHETITCARDPDRVQRVRWQAELRLSAQLDVREKLLEQLFGPPQLEAERAMDHQVVDESVAQRSHATPPGTAVRLCGGPRDPPWHR